MRLNLVTDSISSGSLFGGVGTAILLAVQLARQTGAHLRVVTRTEIADESGFAEVLACNGIEYGRNVEFAYIPFNGADRLDVSDGDRFLTTSWWTTACVLGSISPDRVDYLLQEDERMFYALGDDWVRCHETLSRRDIRFIVNTELLYRHLVKSGLENLLEAGIWFEPAFPAAAKGCETTESDIGKNGGVSSIDCAHESPDADSRSMVMVVSPGDGLGKKKKRLFFYARPNNLRNLYYRGIEALEAAVASGILDPQDWEIVLVGKDASKLSFAGEDAVLLPTMKWKEYGEFIKTVDMAFVLMSTPHPSYPPLDIVANGGVVVTNRFGLKEDLGGYSNNIVMSDLDLPSLVAALKEGVCLAGDDARREVNRRRNGLNHSWMTALQPVVDFLVTPPALDQKEASDVLRQ